MNNDVNSTNNSNEAANTEITIDVHSAPIVPTQPEPVAAPEPVTQPQSAPASESVQPTVASEQPVVAQVPEPVAVPEPASQPVPETQPVQTTEQPVAQPQAPAPVQATEQQVQQVAPASQPQVQQQPVQGPIIASPNTAVRRNFYQGFNQNNGANNNKKKFNLRLVIDIVLLAVVLGGAIYIIFPRDEAEIGEGPEIIDIRNLDAKKTECYETALKYVKLKYDFEPDLTDIAIEADLGETE